LSEKTVRRLKAWFKRFFQAQAGKLQLRRREQISALRISSDRAERAAATHVVEEADVRVHRTPLMMNNLRSLPRHDIITRSVNAHRRDAVFSALDGFVAVRRCRR
jgi:hypothetical protein